MRVERAAFIRALTALSASLAGEHAASARLGPSRPAAVTLPLERCGGAFCTDYFVEGQRFRAVADTGSPFLLVASAPAVGGGSCSEGASSSRWGCFDESGSSTALGDTSEEGFGGQDVGVGESRGTRTRSMMSRSPVVHTPSERVHVRLQSGGAARCALAGQARKHSASRRLILESCGRRLGRAARRQFTWGWQRIGSHAFDRHCWSRRTSSRLSSTLSRSGSRCRASRTLKPTCPSCAIAM